VSYFTIAYYFF